MAYKNAAKSELISFALARNAAKSEFFKLSNDIHAAKGETFPFNKEIVSPVSESFLLQSESAQAYEQGTVVAGKEWLNFVYPLVIVSATLTSPAGEEDFSDFIVSATLKKHLGGKTMLSLKLVEPQVMVGATTLEQLLKLQPSTINPWHVGFADPNGRLIRHNFTTRTRLTLTYQWGDDHYGYQTYEVTKFLPLEPKFNGRELEWELEDYTGLLERQDVSMQDIDIDAPADVSSTDPTTGYNVGVRRQGTLHSVSKEVCSLFGLQCQNNYPDAKIRQMRRKNSQPLNWVDMCNRIRQAKRRMSGSTLINELTTPPHLGNPKWTFKGGQHITEGSFQAYQDLSDYRNQFNVSRTAPNGGQIGEQECIGGQCVGRTGNITFDYPVTVASATVEVTQGTIQDYVYFKPQSTTPVYADPIYALGPSGSSYIGPVTDRVEFTYKATIGVNTGGGFGGLGGLGAGSYSSSILGSNAGLVSYLPRYKVVYFGSAQSGIGVSAVYNYIAKDTTQITEFGLWPEPNIEDPMIADYETMVAYGQALLREATRKMWWVRFRTGYVNPKIECGDIFKIQDYSTEIDHNWLVEEVTITTENGESIMEILGSRGGT